eukprot:jgi/Botrbrau1/1222/Bobra.0163s0029.1
MLAGGSVTQTLLPVAIGNTDHDQLNLSRVFRTSVCLLGRVCVRTVWTSSTSLHTFDECTGLKASFCALTRLSLAGGVGRIFNELVIAFGSACKHTLISTSCNTCHWALNLY